MVTLTPLQAMVAIRWWASQPCTRPCSEKTSCLPCAARMFDVEFEFAGWHLFHYVREFYTCVGRSMPGKVAVWLARRSRDCSRAMFAQALVRAVDSHRAHTEEGHRK